ncbi:flagellar hook-associated protein FlgK [[Clostridium] hylemonae]|uniref:Flagellar hook-associated protein 1 n=1 Tax=[Clostridium] hylemonae DSM 15053 TaxID=553973 RepID=C0C1L3_9FIRM|nr:flagellar hook-associated protein FlgK [[Clostridium] hylemonae]EEG74027.1 flagellar hook-associated protein FlgK [[Clostridium] hylemonae DSM 15053]QEK19416.1 hypothetical protein LAJLEIBI_03448 [[Clostridium] hylemonae DSM 15053]
MIRSTFAGFTMAQQALSANQRAIDVAGQNLSNINTPGYTRQRLDLASISPVGASFSSSVYDNKVGQGVMMKGISQIRDPFLDIQYRNQIAKVGTADAEDQILERLGEIFDETDSAAVREAFNNVITQLKNMANPQDGGASSTDALVRSSFEVLINAIHEKANAVDALEEEMIKKMTDSVIPNINTCLNEIKNLNEEIKNSQILGNPALELQDERNKLLDDLATYLPIEVSYRTDTSGGEPIDLLDVTFRDSAGTKHTLISDTKIGEFHFDGTGGIPVSLEVTDALNPGGGASDITDLIQNGVLKGNIDMLNKAEIFDGTDTKGIGYYRGMFDAFVNKLATVMNDLNGDALFEKSDGSGADQPFTASNIKVSEGWMNGTVSIKKSDGAVGGTGPSTEYKNVQLMINALISDKQVFTVKRPDGADVTVFTGTIQNCYDNIQNVQAIERKASASILKNHLTVLNQISDSRDAVSGVNMDEEVMDLMRYHQSYNAASRLMTTMDEMLDKLINDTGVVGR